MLTERSLELKDARITPENFAEFILLLDRSDVGSANAQKLLALMIGTDADPSHVMEDHNLGQKMDEEKLMTEIKRLVEQNPDQVAQYKAGKNP